jgi:nucleotide-binding universal stress UspA family protein
MLWPVALEAVRLPQCFAFLCEATEGQAGKGEQMRVGQKPTRVGIRIIDHQKEHVMEKHLLLGVDEDFSPSTQWALRTVSQLFEQSSDRLHLTLVTVIPYPYDPSSFMVTAQRRGELHPHSPTPAQREQAQAVLHQASDLLQLYCPDMAPQWVKRVQCVGEPANEVVKVARQQQTDCIVLGNRGSSSMQHLRRIFSRSTSYEIMRLAPCPVLLVTQPQHPRLPGLVTWYERAITRYLQEQLDSLTVFTPESVTHMFVPLSHRSTQHTKLTAAAQALEHLAHCGQLSCHMIEGERQYVNILDRSHST